MGALAAIFGTALLPFGTALAGDATKARASASPKPRTLLAVRGQIEGFAQDGDAIVWANRDQPCARHILYRRLSTGKTRSLVSPKGPVCKGEEFDGIQHRMALAGTRALWVYINAGNSTFLYVPYTAAVGDRRERRLGSIPKSGGRENESSFRPLPIAGDGPTLALADVSNTESREAEGVYRVAPALSRLSGTWGADTLAVAGRRLAFTRYIGPGCVCNYSPQLSPDGRTIAFGSRRLRSGAEELYAMSADGTRLRRLLQGVGEASFSPNGRSLLYVRTRILPLGYGWPEIYVASSDGTASRRLAGGDRELVATPSWSPDGRSVAYVSSESVRPKYVFIVRSLGGKPIRIAPGDQPAWSPDGTKISLVRADGLYVVDLATRAVRRIVSHTVVRHHWSPDGTRIALLVSAGDDYELHSLLSDGTGRTRIAAAAGEIAWSPDSSTIAFSRASGNESSVIALVSAVGGTPRDLTPGSSPVWSSDGRSLVYVVRGDAHEDGFDTEIARIATDGSSGQILTRTEPARGRNAVEVRHARTGKTVATFNTAVPSDRATAPSAVALSGSRIALLFYKSRTSRRLEIRTLRGSLTRTISVARPDADEIFMSGRWLVFRTGAVIRSVDVRSGGQSVLTRARGNVVGLSIDGRRVAWAEQGARTSRIRALVLPQ